MKEFYLETNQVFSWIKTEEELILAFAILTKSHYDLDKIKNTDYDPINFGTRREHRGDVTLLSWLEKENGINLIYGKNSPYPWVGDELTGT
jgi:hypothetical protein